MEAFRIFGKVFCRRHRLHVVFLPPEWCAHIIACGDTGCPMKAALFLRLLVKVNSGRGGSYFYKPEVTFVSELSLSEEPRNIGGKLT